MLSCSNKYSVEMFEVTRAVLHPGAFSTAKMSKAFAHNTAGCALLGLCCWTGNPA